MPIELPEPIRHHPWPVLLLALAGFCSAHATAATVVPQVKVQTISLDGVGTVPFLINEFDTRRGTLDSVDVSVNLVVTSTSATLPNLVPVGLGVMIPSAYAAQVQVGLGFSGHQGRGFSSIVESMAFSPLFADGAGSPAISVSLFHFGFTVDDEQDLTGIAKADHYDGATPMLFKTELRNFLPKDPMVTGIPVLGSLDVSLLALDPRVIPLTAMVSGDMTITYNYLKTLEPPAPVPLPAAAWLFGSALIGAGLLGRKRRKA
jgi:hypothetical protein